jgi:integrase/recombinase XerD
MTSTIDWPSFAFSETSAWGRCLFAFLRQSYERSGSNSTLQRYTHVLNRFLSSPAKLPSLYTREDVETFIHSPGQAKGREGKPVSPGTRNNRLSVITAFYAYSAAYTITDDARSIHPILQTPPPVLGMRHLQRARSAHRGLSQDELRRFFAAIPRDTVIGQRDYALFLTYFLTARRLQEISRLRWGDISEAIIRENGKQRTIRMYRFYGKGHQRQSDAQELPELAYKAITAYLEASGRLASIQDDYAVFTMVESRRGKYRYDPRRPLSPQHIWYTAKKIAVKAGISTAKVDVHVFRHTSARIRYEQGADIREIQHLLRHASLATTDLYLRQIMPSADPGARLLGEMFGDL